MRFLLGLLKNTYFKRSSRGLRLSFGVIARCFPFDAMQAMLLSVLERQLLDNGIPMVADELLVD